MDRMIHPDDQESAYEIFNRALAGLSQSTRMSFRQLSGDGNYEWWEYRTSVLAGLTTDTPYSILGVCQSIQRYKTTEEELTAARDKALQADKLKSAFLANMSHEIRTPLNAIIGFSDLICQTDDAEEKEEYIRIVTSNNELLLQLIDDILDLSKIEAGTMDFSYAPTDINELMEDICLQMQQKNQRPEVQIMFTEKEPGCVINTDRLRLSQVIMNLMNNAMKFTSEGSITLGYRLTRQKDELYFFVKDTGIGIPADQAGKVFERFVKLNTFIKGTGLGLAICRVIIERLGGTIGVETREGKGACFWFRLPVREDMLLESPVR